MSKPKQRSIPLKKKSRYRSEDSQDSPPTRKREASPQRDMQKHLALEFAKALRTLVPEPKKES